MTTSIGGNELFLGITNKPKQLDNLSLNRLSLVGCETGTEFIVNGCFKYFYGPNTNNNTPSTGTTGPINSARWVSTGTFGCGITPTWAPSNAYSSGTVTDPDYVPIYNPNVDISVTNVSLLPVTFDNKTQVTSVIKFPFACLLEQIDLKWESVDDGTGEVFANSTPIIGTPSFAKTFIDIGTIEPGAPSSPYYWKSLTRPIPQQYDAEIKTGQGLVSWGLQTDDSQQVSIGHPELSAASIGVVGPGGTDSNGKTIFIDPNYDARNVFVCQNPPPSTFAEKPLAGTGGDQTEFSKPLGTKWPIYIAANTAISIVAVQENLLVDSPNTYTNPWTIRGGRDVPEGNMHFNLTLKRLGPSMADNSGNSFRGTPYVEPTMPPV